MLGSFLYDILLLLIHLYLACRGVLLRAGLLPGKLLLREKIEESGIVVDGSEGHDIQVNSDEFYYWTMNEQALGLGESYMEGHWDCDQLDECFARLYKGEGIHKFFMSFPDARLFHFLKFQLFNRKTAERFSKVRGKHYELGTSVLYKSFLDETMSYSCGYWRTAQNLKEAQISKMELIGKKLKLRQGMRILELGCGWGSLCKYLAETYSVHVTGVTLSKEEAESALTLCQGLPVEILLLQEYKEVEGVFDRIVAIELLEYVLSQGEYRQFFEFIHQRLNPYGIFLCDSVGVDKDERVPTVEPWMNKYIFPNGVLPHPGDITSSIENLFTIEDWHSFGADYDKTFLEWHANYRKNWSKICHLFLDPQGFYRKWTYYLLMCAGLFRTRKFQLWQIVLSKGGCPGGYESIR